MLCFDVTSRYSSEAILKEKLTYAMNNCNTIDMDETLEGRANQAMRGPEDRDE